VETVIPSREKVIAPVIIVVKAMEVVLERRIGRISRERQKEEIRQSRKRTREVDDKVIICYQCGQSGDMQNDCEVKKRVYNIK
jgi:hypothetical protein